MDITDEVVDALIKEKKEIEALRLVDPFDADLKEQHGIIIKRCTDVIKVLYTAIKKGV